MLSSSLHYSTISLSSKRHAQTVAAPSFLGIDSSKFLSKMEDTCHFYVYTIHFYTYTILIFQVQSFKGLILQPQLGYDSMLKGSICVSKIFA